MYNLAEVSVVAVTAGLCGAGFIWACTTYFNTHVFLKKLKRLEMKCKEYTDNLQELSDTVMEAGRITDTGILPLKIVGDMSLKIQGNKDRHYTYIELLDMIVSVAEQSAYKSGLERSLKEYKSIFGE